jgi:hypothetical protein
VSRRQLLVDTADLTPEIGRLQDLGRGAIRHHGSHERSAVRDPKAHGRPGGGLFEDGARPEDLGDGGQQPGLLHAHRGYSSPSVARATT